MTTPHGIAILALFVLACGGSEAPPPEAPEEPATAAPSASEPAEAAEPAAPCDGADEVLEGSVSFAEDVGKVATEAQGDCGAFADGLDKLVEARADWIAEMKERSAALEEAGCTDPEVPPELERRGQAAMQSVAEIAQTCQGDPRFEEAMKAAFAKQTQ